VRLLFDECVEVGLTDHLRTCGHDVVLVQDIERGAEDQRVVSLAAELERVLVTEDKDFGELAVRQRRPLPGVVLLRIAPSRRQVKAARLAAVLAHRAGRIAGSYTVVQEDKIRIRPLMTKR
jgi:predicted nuclease of predicted toxin-antitoxin system